MTPRQRFRLQRAIYDLWGDGESVMDVLRTEDAIHELEDEGISAQDLLDSAKVEFERVFNDTKAG